MPNVFLFWNEDGKICPMQCQTKIPWQTNEFWGSVISHSAKVEWTSLPGRWMCKAHYFVHSSVVVRPMHHMQKSKRKHAASWSCLPGKCTRACNTHCSSLFVKPQGNRLPQTREAFQVQSALCQLPQGCTLGPSRHGTPLFIPGVPCLEGTKTSTLRLGAHFYPKRKFFSLIQRQKQAEKSAKQKKERNWWEKKICGLLWTLTRCRAPSYVF